MRKRHLSPLVAEQAHAGATMLPATPIFPEQGRRSRLERMQQDADLARLARFAAIPLALLAQRTGTTTANARSIHHAQAPIGFSTPLMSRERLACWVPQCSIRLESKILAREATGLPCCTYSWRSIARGRSGVRGRRWGSWRKFGCAQWLRIELMAQLESEVPDPLRDHVPGFLPPGRLAAPPVRVLLFVFV